VIRRQLAILLPIAVALFQTAASAQIVVDAPPSLTAAAVRVERSSLPRLRDSLARAGLDLPSDIRVTLLPEDDPRVGDIPDWIVGFALGERDIVIMPSRVLSYPYDSLESVVRHEVTHLALTSRAGGRPLPRWFHEGVAVSVDSGWDTAARFRLLLAMIEGPRIQQLTRLFGSGNQPDTTQVYLRRRHGADLPGAIAARVATGVPFDQAFLLETSETPDAAAARAWAAYRRWTAWVPAITSPSAAWTVILILACVAFVVQRRRRARRRRQWDAEERRQAVPGDREERRQAVPGDPEERRSGVPGDPEERRSGVPGDREEIRSVPTLSEPGGTPLRRSGRPDAAQREPEGE
jgi:hypothetical protein